MRLARCLGAGMLLIAAAAAPASAQQYQFGYKAFYSGLKIAEATARLHWTDGQYSLKIDAKSGGAVDWFVDIEHTTWSRGALDTSPERQSLGLQPKSHEYHSRDGKKRTSVALAFTPWTASIVKATPHPSTENRKPVPDGLKVGVFDPLSGALALMRAATEQGECSGRVPVFDGRRRYDTVLENPQHEVRGGPRGKRPTLVCDFRFERIAGYRPKAKKWKGVKGKVWVQQLAEGLPMVPVRITMDTRYGTGIIQMVSARPAN